MPDSTLKFSIHQPNYIPWVGYFHKIYHSDIFIFLDTVQYPRGQSVANRNLILGHNGPFYLSIPINKKIGKDGKFLYSETEFSDKNWKAAHLKSISLCYKKSRFFNDVFPMLSSIIEKDLPFCKMNIEIINVICNYLEIKTKKVLLSDILTSFGQKTRLIIDIGKSINANIYLCGSGGGVEYTNPDELNENNISISYLRYSLPGYPQHNSNTFVPRLSILDLLFNCGKESITYIR